MADGPVDPASLEGDALTRWYRRTPQQIAEERRRAAAEAYNRFFYPTPSDPALNTDSAVDIQDSSPGDGQEPTDGQVDRSAGYSTAPPPAQATEKPASFPSVYGTGLLGDWRRYTDVPANASGPNASFVAPADDTLWIATGSGAYRPVRSPNSNSGAWLRTPPSLLDGLPQNPAAPEDAYLLYVGNPYNRGLKREHEKATGETWPRTDDGRSYHVAHKRAIADGGPNTLDNIEPMHPDDHIAQHLNNGDSARWGKRASIARAFGGTVEPLAPGRVVRGLGLAGAIPWITGFLSGNIRTDTPVHMWYDMAGYPAPDDYQHMVDPRCRALGINEPGKVCT